MAFARFDLRQIGQHLPATAGAPRFMNNQSAQSPCLRPCRLMQSGRAFPHRRTAKVVQILTKTPATSLRCCWCWLDLTRVKSGRACLPRQARQPRSPGREGFRARSTLKSVHWTDLTPPSRGRVLPRQARPDLPAIGVRQRPCLPPCGVQQSGRAFPHRGTATPTLGPMSPCQSLQAVLRQNLNRHRSRRVSSCT